MKSGLKAAASWSRREFARVLGAGLGLHALAPLAPATEILTVSGSRSPADLGVTLMHEHVMVDFIGAAAVRRERYDEETVFRTALPHLERVREQGCGTLVECTPAYIGRDPSLLKRLAAASGIHILTNTGYYGAAEDRFVPAHAYTETAGQLASRWTREFEEGIEGTGIRPGFMKIGVDKGPLSEIDAKLVRAAAFTHLKTGLTIASHTGDGVAAMAELKLLGREGVSPSAFIWVHAQNEPGQDYHFKAAEAGAWVEFDGIRDSSLETHLRLVRGMIERGHLRRILISQDAGWYHVGEPGGGSFRGYDLVFTEFLPALKGAGITDGQIRTLLAENPRDALRIRVRPANRADRR